MAAVSEEKVNDIGKILLDETKPLKQRFRALFSLRNIPGAASIAYIKAGFKDPSALLKHELAYCLGQMQDENAIPYLVEVLEDTNQEPIVRHEAAEALGAIGRSSVVDVLEKYSKSEVREIAETCQLAIQRLEKVESGNIGKDSKNPFESVDPTPASNLKDVESLKKILLDESLPLFERYEAMFALRNLRSNESAMVLTQGLKTPSALFSHEVAFVLGQLQNEVTVPALIDCLEDVSQNEMVRHECAEALGAIATTECLEVLHKYLQDEKRVVRESCEIALDMCEYENSNDFQYALT